MNMTYLLSNTEDPQFDHRVSFRDKVFQTNLDSFHKTENSERSVILYGEVFDFRHAERNIEQLAEALAACKTYEGLLAEAEYLVGRYLIISHTDEEGIRLLGDATGTIPVYYPTRAGQEACSSHVYLMSQLYDLPKSDVAKQIRAQAMEQQQPMPYDFTTISYVKVLLPNHYLDLSKGESVRYYPLVDLPERTVDEVVDETIRVMDKVVNKVYDAHDIAIAMTSGLDSRVVLSFFKDKKDIKLYTYVHENFTEETPDVYVPKQISEKFGLDYYTLIRKQLSDEDLKDIESYLPGHMNQRILENSFTFSTSELKDRSFITGDIIPLAKSKFGQNLPEKKATTSYFVTKSHNYSKENRQLIAEWLEDLNRDKDSDVSTYDLFFWENRLGRWFTKNAVNYDMFSNPLYIFNSRYLINLWLSVPRKYRVEKQIHQGIIAKNWPELLEIPVNPGGSKLSKVFLNQWAYYYGSFIKHYANKYRK